jgi:adenylate cyclase
MIPRILKNKIGKTITFSLFIAIIVAFLLSVGFLNTWEARISDTFYYPTSPLSEIIIVEIDDESIYKIGEWPFSRDNYATVIENINESSVIGIDILFDIPREGDAEFANALKNNSVVLAVEYKDLYTKDGKVYSKEVLSPNSSLGEAGDDFKTGFINLFTDDDKVTRSIATKIYSNIEDHDPFSAVIVGEYTGIKPKLDSQRMLINYYSEPGGYTYVSFYDVYNNSENLPDFTGKIVLIGYTASGVDDTFGIPISNKAMAGVEIHANLVQSILTRDFIEYQDDLSAIGVIFLFALITGLLLCFLRIHYATILIIVIFVAYFLIALLIIFDSYGVILNILFPLFTIVFVYITNVVIYYRTEEKSRKWITSVFGKYVSPMVIENLIKNPEKLNLGGETKDITIFFSDIRGFTSISERLEPEELVHLLNEYLTEMTSIVINNQGLVDKYMGDAIMAFWGAPLDQPNHAEMACLSSLEMVDKLRELKKKWKKEGIPSFDIGIGLNSGNAIVGNMGSFERFDYTAMGDNVNLASRLEGLNKIYGTDIIISKKTYDIVKDKFEARRLDVVKVKGKKKPISIYELLSIKDKLNKEHRDFVKFYEEGLDLYFNKKWKEAIKSFQSALKIKKDTASKVFIDRCNEFQKNSPPKDWDGVWEMKFK